MVHLQINLYNTIERNAMKRRCILAAVLFFQVTLLVHAKSDITLSVLYFYNLAQVEEFSYLTKALSEMLISDLQQVKDIVIIEREQIEKVTQEMALGQTGMINEITAPKVGGMLGARYLLTGS